MAQRTRNTARVGYILLSQSDASHLRNPARTCETESLPRCLAHATRQLPSAGCRVIAAKQNNTSQKRGTINETPSTLLETHNKEPPKTPQGRYKPRQDKSDVGRGDRSRNKRKRWRQGSEDEGVDGGTLREREKQQSCGGVARKKQRCDSLKSDGRGDKRDRRRTRGDGKGLPSATTLNSLNRPYSPYSLYSPAHKPRQAFLVVSRQPRSARGS